MNLIVWPFLFLVACRKAAPPNTTLPPASPVGQCCSNLPLDELVDGFVRDKGAVGAVLGVAHQGTESTHVAGFRAWVAQVPLEAETLVPIASISKMITAVTILRLHENGVVSLDAPVSNVVTHPWDPELTARQLLAHTAGVPNDDTLGDGFDRTDALAVLQAMSEHPAVGPAGGQFAYSNTGYQMLGATIEALEGARYEEVVKQQVFDPLGMRNTVLCHQASNPAASGHRTRDGDVEATPPVRHLAEGGWCSTAGDLLRFANGLQGLLTPDSLEMMTTAQPLADGTTAPTGLGMFLGEWKGHRTWSHSGLLQGSRSILVIYPDDDLVVTGVGLSRSAAIDSLQHDVARKVFGIEHEVAEHRPVSQQARQRCLGRYSLDNVGILRLESTESKEIMLLLEGRFRSGLSHQGRDRFLLDDVDDTAIVCADDHLMFYQAGMELRFEPIEPVPDLPVSIELKERLTGDYGSPDLHVSIRALPNGLAIEVEGQDSQPLRRLRSTTFGLDFDPAILLVFDPDGTQVTLRQEGAEFLMHRVER